MIAIVDYNAGNIASVRNALARLNYPSVVTSDNKIIRNAEKVILPGVGSADRAMRALKDTGLDDVIKSLSQPTLGICLGMQLMCKYSDEGLTDCLSIFETDVRKIPAGGVVPHMGWNSLTDISGPLFDNVSNGDDVYFVHTYYAELCDDTVASCNYNIHFSAALQKDNFYATQFHPEKSSTVGEIILSNFLKL